MRSNAVTGVRVRFRTVMPAGARALPPAVFAVEARKSIRALLAGACAETWQPPEEFRERARRYEFEMVDGEWPGDDRHDFQ